MIELSRCIVCSNIIIIPLALLVEEIIIVVIKVSAVTLIKSIIYVKEFDCTLENCIPSKVKSSVTEIKKIIGYTLFED